MLDRLAPSPDGGCDEVPPSGRAVVATGRYVRNKAQVDPLPATFLIMNRGGSSAGCLRSRFAGFALLRTARGGAAGALGGARDREARHVQALPRAHAARLPDF